MRLIFVLLLSIALLNCAKEDTTFYNNFYSQSPKLHQSTCSLFQDNTFRGEVKASFTPSGEYDPQCIEVHIFDSPDTLLELDNLFVQAYPFNYEDKEGFVSGSAFKFEVYKSGNALEEEYLVSSKILDSHLAKSLDSPKSFFRKHYFKICRDDLQDWDAMQFVVYHETDEVYKNKYDIEKTKKKHSHIRITRFLIPPFESHPEHFRKDKGDALAVYHPFIHSKNKNKLASEEFLEKSRSVCESDGY